MWWLAACTSTLPPPPEARPPAAPNSHVWRPPTQGSVAFHTPMDGSDKTAGVLFVEIDGLMGAELQLRVRHDGTWALKGESPDAIGFYDRPLGEGRVGDGGLLEGLDTARFKGAVGFWAAPGAFTFDGVEVPSK